LEIWFEKTNFLDKRTSHDAKEEQMNQEEQASEEGNEGFEPDHIDTVCVKCKKSCTGLVCCDSGYTIVNGFCVHESPCCVLCCAPNHPPKENRTFLDGIYDQASIERRRRFMRDLKRRIEVLGVLPNLPFEREDIYKENGKEWAVSHINGEIFMITDEDEDVSTYFSI